MLRILFQGDSITDGNRYKDPASRWDLNHQIGHSYAFIAAGYLGRKYPGKYTFINRGVSGDRVESIAARWQTDTLDEHPDILSLLLGINGSNFEGIYPEGEEVHLDRFTRGYRDLLTRAREANPALKLLLIEPFCLPVGQRGATYDAFLPVFRAKQQAIRALAAEFGAAFVPTQQRLEALAAECIPALAENGCPTDGNAYWLWDGIHPTEALHSALAEWWLEAFAAL